MSGNVNARPPLPRQTNAVTSSSLPRRALSSGRSLVRPGSKTSIKNCQLVQPARRPQLSSPYIQRNSQSGRPSPTAFIQHINNVSNEKTSSTTTQSERLINANNNSSADYETLYLSSISESVSYRESFNTGFVFPNTVTASMLYSDDDDEIEENESVINNLTDDHKIYMRNSAVQYEMNRNIFEDIPATDSDTDSNSSLCSDEETSQNLALNMSISSAEAEDLGVTYITDDNNHIGRESSSIYYNTSSDSEEESLSCSFALNKTLKNPVLNETERSIEADELSITHTMENDENINGDSSSIFYYSSFCEDSKDDTIIDLSDGISTHNHSKLSPNYTHNSDSSIEAEDLSITYESQDDICGFLDSSSIFYKSSCCSETLGDHKSNSHIDSHINTENVCNLTGTYVNATIVENMDVTSASDMSQFMNEPIIAKLPITTIVKSASSNKKKVIISKKLKNIGKYFNRISGLGTTKPVHFQKLTVI